MTLQPIKRALLSVSDKSGLLKFAQTLNSLNIEILSTGGTAILLREAGIPVKEVAEYTGFPEILDGRVKTLHPKIHGGLLARDTNPEHLAAVEKHQIALIDLVVINLYPFASTIAKPNVTFEEVIENIDIGGPAMLRSAAKNHERVTVITDPQDYEWMSEQLIKHQGTTFEQRLALATKVFAHTARYDGLIANHLSRPDLNEKSAGNFPEFLHLSFNKVQDLRYGENPHQAAAFYRDETKTAGSLSEYQQIQGKELSYNNIADSDAAWEAVKAFHSPACVIVKHANPCGVALGLDSLEAYQKAWKTDSTSAFGGIIAFNQEVDEKTAKAVSSQFLEVLIAPGYSQGALTILAAKPNVRVLMVPLSKDTHRYDYKRVGGGILVSTPDAIDESPEQWTVVTEKKPTESELKDLAFAWTCAKFIKSNAVVFCKNGMTIGIGAGQMSRVDAAKIASIKAANAQLSLEGSVVASDAFFPFRDGLDVVIDAGARFVIQPGGSMRDQEVIDAANEREIVMVFTGVRHFRH